MSFSLIKQVYLPPTSIVNFSFERWLGTDLIRYYSLGRYALAESFRIAGIGSGDYVALPEFVCEDVPATVTEFGASIYYYPVDEGLQPIDFTPELRKAKAIVIVNYFGFPQNIDTFEKVAKESGAVLIEDNAHGFLSRDKNNIPLGTRCTLGVISIRKSLPVVNGAALILNDKLLARKLPSQLPSNDDALPLVFRIKNLLRKVVPLIGVKPCRAVTWAVRKLRARSTVDEGDVTRDSISPQPYKQLFQQLRNVSPDDEVSRRRELYNLVEKEIRDCGGQPVFNNLPQGTSPYVFPFRMQKEKVESVRNRLNLLNLECYRWPDLPDEIRVLSKSHYSNVWMVPFLW